MEVAALTDRVMVRDSKDTTGPSLAVSPEQWQAFLSGLSDIRQ